MLHGWCHVKCCRFGASSVYTIQPCTRSQCHFIQSHIGRVYVCLGVTCHLHFWQNDRDLLRATAVTRGWNGYRNKSQHRKLTLEKKILPPLLEGFKPATFKSRVRRAKPLSYPAHRGLEGDRELTALKRCHTNTTTKNQMACRDGVSEHRMACWDGVSGHHMACWDGVSGHRMACWDGVSGHGMACWDGASGHRMACWDGVSGHRILYSHAWCELPQAIQIFVVVLM